MDLNQAFNLVLDKVQNWFITLIDMLPNILVAALILVLGLAIAKRVKAFFKRKFSNYFPSQTLADMTFNVVYLALIILVSLIALNILGLDSTIKGALAGAGIVGLGLAFAFQDIAANFISGIFLAFRRPFYQQELIRVKDLEGFVVEVKLRDTTIKTYQGQLVTIPNKEIFENPIINYTRLGKRRADLYASVYAANDLENVKEVALNATKGIPGILNERTHFFYTEIDHRVIRFRIEVWVGSGEFTRYKQFLSDAIMTIDRAFKENGITLANKGYSIDFDNKVESGEILKEA